ncbi:MULTISPECIES: response regulator [Cellulophaga]|uniref:Response regulator receiver protein n=2 Tax=Cellulophaga TaxID=104264 RepID=F0RFG0_CELLC|nr:MULTISPECIES: response regulator [Cellulophaga]ADY27902.1 response regulator receiver protein [Cellulophaga lytica DSM 7489]AIM62146.1 histidine kinase [Cellulophaga lytica]APU08789.1 histidine kinase [Cellulophaga lytica]EWH10676.1 response regulator receiver protein [Cellulophaga geojensis KL-A]MDO6855350.1 response regulator [Cellulophaga lytica]
MENKTTNLCKILLIEDDVVTNFITTSKLNNLGYSNITAVENGKEAIDYLKDNKPDLIVLDLNMPIMDGFEFMESKEQNCICMGVPIVIVTSSGRPSDKEKAKTFLDVISYLEKPLNYDKLQKILMSLRQCLK